MVSIKLEIGPIQRRWVGLIAAAVLLLAAVGVGVWTTQRPAQALEEEVYDVALGGLWVDGKPVDFAALSKLPLEQIVAAMKTMKGQTFYAEGRIYTGGTGNSRGTTPAGTYYCIGGIIADFESPTPKLTIAQEIWAITGKGEINTLGLETVFGPPPGFSLDYSVAAGTGVYISGNVRGAYRRVEIDPDGKPFNGDEILRGYFTRWQ